MVFLVFVYRDCWRIAPLCAHGAPPTRPQARPCVLQIVILRVVPLASFPFPSEGFPQENPAENSSDKNGMDMIILDSFISVFLYTVRFPHSKRDDFRTS